MICSHAEGPDKDIRYLPLLLSYLFRFWVGLLAGWLAGSSQELPVSIP